MVDQAADAGNANDVSRRRRHISVVKHGTIIDALMRSFVV